MFHCACTCFHSGSGNIGTHEKEEGSIDLQVRKPADLTAIGRELLERVEADKHGMYRQCGACVRCPVPRERAAVRVILLFERQVMDLLLGHRDHSLDIVSFGRFGMWCSSRLR